MSLKSCEKAETNIYALEISLEGEEFKKAVSNAYNKNKGRYNVPGFRKGKAPKHIIETYYGKEVFWYDAIDAEYPELFDAAAKEAGIVPVAAPFDDEIVSLDENGFTVKLKVVVKPSAEVKKYKGLTAEKEKVSVKKAEVKDAVNAALERDAKMVTVEDRAAKKGDTAVIDFEGFMDGKAFDGGKGENHNLELGSGQFIDGFEDQIVGKKTGDEFDVNVTFPEEYTEELCRQIAATSFGLGQMDAQYYKGYDMPIDDVFVDSDGNEYTAMFGYDDFLRLYKNEEVVFEKEMPKDKKTVAVNKDGKYRCSKCGSWVSHVTAKGYSFQDTLDAISGTKVTDSTQGAEGVFNNNKTGNIWLIPIIILLLLSLGVLIYAKNDEGGKWLKDNFGIELLNECNIICEQVAF